MRRIKNDVSWTFPNRKRPFDYSTIATSNLICLLYKEFKDLRKVYENINYDEDAKRILKKYIDNDIYKINIEYI